MKKEIITFTRIEKEIEIEGIKTIATLYQVKDRLFGDKTKAIDYINQLRDARHKAQHEEKRKEDLLTIARTLAKFERKYHVILGEDVDDSEFSWLSFRVLINSEKRKIVADELMHREHCEKTRVVKKTNPTTTGE